MEEIESKSVVSLKKEQTENQQANQSSSDETNNQASTKATVSLVMGIISIAGNVMWGWGSFPCLILGIIGLVLSSKAKKQIKNGIVTGGFVTSLIGTILSGVAIVTAILAVAGVFTLLGIGFFSLL